MAQQHGEGCFCYDCVTQWAAQHDPNTGRRRSGRASGPPIAKNPANQEYINKCWKEEQERKAAERSQRRGGGRGRRSGSGPSTDFGTGNTGRYGDNRYTDPVHGTASDGRNVTASFGREGTSREGHSLLKDGHVESPSDFYGPNGAEEHDHYDGRGGGTRRGKHSG